MIIETENLTVNRGGTVLEFADIALERGSKLLLTGASGSGKTTLLSLIAGLLRPLSGTVRVEGRDIMALDASSLDRVRGRHFGFVFQTLHLLPYLSVEDNILLAARMTGASADRERARRLLSAVGLEHKAQRRPASLSHGEQQRAAICRAVYNRPSVIVADELTSALDDDTAKATIDLLERQAAEHGAALIVATHDRRIAARFSSTMNLSPPITSGMAA